MLDIRQKLDEPSQQFAPSRVADADPYYRRAIGVERLEHHKVLVLGDQDGVNSQARAQMRRSEASNNPQSKTCSASCPR